MDFEKHCMMFAMQQPFYGVLLSAMHRAPVESGPIKTLGVCRSGNVFKLLYNPRFVESLPTDTVQMLILHEVLHLAMQHFSVWDEPTVDPHERELRNIAADLEVNGYLDRSKLDEKAKGIFAEDFGWKNHLGARQYLRLLKEREEKAREEARQRQQQKRMQDQREEPDNNAPAGEESPQEGQSEETEESPSDGSSGNGSPSQEGSPDHDNSSPQETDPGEGSASDNDPLGLGSMAGFDDHSMWPDEGESSSATLQEITQSIDSLLDFAAEQVEKGHGSIPGERKGRIDRSRRKPRPATDWKRHLRRYLGNELSDTTRRTRKRLSRRYPDAPGKRHDRKSHVLVAIDTSGSVSMPEYREFFGQIASLSRHASFHVIECDARIQHEYDFAGQIPEVLHGGGGTDFQPVVDYFNRNRRKYDSLIYFTDGYSEIPDDTPRETLWVISSRGNHDRRRYKVNGASVVIIPKQK